MPSQRERTWVGRAIIALATLLALALVLASRHSESNPLSMIVVLGLLAIAFSTQLLPMTVDMLYLQWGTRQGAIAGVAVGLVVIFILSPFFPMVFGQSGQGLIALMKRSIDIGAWALFFNAATFIVVSAYTRSTDSTNASPASQTRRSSLQHMLCVDSPLASGARNAVQHTLENKDVYGIDPMPVEKTKESKWIENSRLIHDAFIAFRADLKL